LPTCHRRCLRREAGPKSQGADLQAQRAPAPQRVPEVEAQADLELAAQNPADQEAEALPSLKAQFGLYQDQGHAQAADPGVGVDQIVEARVQPKPQDHQVRSKLLARRVQFRPQDLHPANQGIAARAQRGCHRLLQRLHGDCCARQH